MRKGKGLQSRRPGLSATGWAADGPYGRDSITPLAVKTMNCFAGQLSPSIKSEGRKL